MPDPDGMTWIPGGTFRMGSELAGYPEEGPPHLVTVAGFWMDTAPVTVARFAAFAAATGYRTVAERPLDPRAYPDLAAEALVPGSLVFWPAAGPVDLADPLTWWQYVPGADWAHPEGPGSTADGRGDHPVVHVCWEDVVAYAAWAGKDVATEAEWELAARGGLDGVRYAWGDEFAPGGRLMANTWIGEFPWQNLKPREIQRTTPVGSFPANGFGLLDITGNVWEWTRDFYRARHSPAGHACCAVTDPRFDDAAGSFGTQEAGGAHVPRRVVKGGSHLCAPNYCERYRPAARQAQQVESSMSHLGFRCVIRPSS
jgi:formylglycine-generating enzyme required for sulfatase activity